MASMLRSPRCCGRVFLKAPLRRCCIKSNAGRSGWTSMLDKLAACSAGFHTTNIRHLLFEDFPGGVTSLAVTFQEGNRGRMTLEEFLINIPRKSPVLENPDDDAGDHDVIDATSVANDDDDVRSSSNIDSNKVKGGDFSLNALASNVLLGGDSRLSSGHNAIVKDCGQSTATNRHQHPSPLSSSSNKKIANNNFMSNIWSQPYTTAITSTEEDKLLIDNFEVILNSLVSHTAFQNLPDAKSIYRRSLTYSLLGGRRFRAHGVLRTFFALASKEDAKRLARKAAVVAWCVEMMLRSSQMTGDLIRGIKANGSRISWHRLDNVGLRAVYDGDLLQRSIFHLLEKECRSFRFYSDLLDQFHETALAVTFGDTLEFLTYPRRRNTLSSAWLNQKRMQTVLKYRNMTQLFELPVYAGMSIAGFTDIRKRRAVKELIKKIGNYSQFVVQYLNAFGDLEATLDVGDDIQSGRCTWLIAVAWEQANESQRKALLEHYGNDDPDSVRTVRDLFYDLEVPTLYQEVSKDFREEIVNDLTYVMEKFQDPRIHMMVTRYFDLVHWYLYHSKILLGPNITPLSSLL